MTRVLIVEDDPMACQLLEIFISQSTNYVVDSTIESAALTEFCCRTRPVDLILMDVCTAFHSNGIEAAKKIKQCFPHIKIIIITGQPEYSFVERARHVGADSFWYKNADAESLLEIMDRTMAGKQIYPDKTPQVPLGNISSEMLTDREIEVLREVVAGETDAAIADKLHLSLRTVKGHIQAMREKTGFRNRTELAVRARDCGLIINDIIKE